MVIRREPGEPIYEPLFHTFQTNDEESRHNKTISIKVG